MTVSYGIHYVSGVVALVQFRLSVAFLLDELMPYLFSIMFIIHEGVNVFV